MKGKRILSILITLCMVATMLSAVPVTVEAAQITSPISLTANPVDCSGDGWSWTQSTKTLTLSRIDLKVTGNDAIYLPADTKIILAPGSTNSITVHGGNNGGHYV